MPLSNIPGASGGLDTAKSALAGLQSLFSGNASDDLAAKDSYLEGDAARRIADAKASGSIKDTLGIKDTSYFSKLEDKCKPKPPSDKEKVAAEKKAMPEFLSKIRSRIEKTTSSCTYKKFEAALKGVQNASNFMTDYGMPGQLALSAISSALPFQLTVACQAIVDNFIRKLPKRFAGYEVKDKSGATRFMRSNEVQCAMDAMSMLTGIKGLHGKVETLVVDIESSALVLAGIMGTLIDYGMTNDIENVASLASTDKTRERAIGMVSPKVVESGDLNLMNWMLDNIGTEGAKTYIPDIEEKVCSNYVKKEMDGPDDLFDLLDRLNPNWDKEGEIYHGDVVANLSPDAQELFEARDDYKTIAMVGHMEFVPESTGRKATIFEVTKTLYPEALGPGRVRDSSTSDPSYLYR